MADIYAHCKRESGELLIFDDFHVVYPLGGQAAFCNNGTNSVHFTMFSVQVTM